MGKRTEKRCEWFEFSVSKEQAGANRAGTYKSWGSNRERAGERLSVALSHQGKMRMFLNNGLIKRPCLDGVETISSA